MSGAAKSGKENKEPRLEFFCAKRGTRKDPGNRFYRRWFGYTPRRERRL